MFTLDMKTSSEKVLLQRCEILICHRAIRSQEIR
jgi:hypothetical protein